MNQNLMFIPQTERKLYHIVSAYTHTHTKVTVAMHHLYFLLNALFRARKGTKQLLVYINVNASSRNHD